ncbi:Rossmann fold domain-containing protein [Novosphingobium rosa]|uniref:Rossmann fold domain-containing protein n=1 Tax=Novosphingobium rosa TaxID=76978 RepID=UPI001FDEABDE|nr:hypothetical protein [Novosphingobium rosa]
MSDAMQVILVDDLPAAPLAAAAHFHGFIVPQIEARAQGASGVTLLLPAADDTHRAWRAAALGALARALAPARINALAGGDEAARERALGFVEGAPGLTGQVLPLDGARAGEVLD